MADASLADEAAWVEGLRRADPGAFDAVYAHYRPRIFSFLARLTGTRALAEDLMQETFLRLARRARDLDPATRLAPFLFTVARNLAYDHRRWARLDRSRLTEVARDAGGRGHGGATPFDLTQASETQRALEAALARLPARLREALLLVVVEGLAPAEAAAVLRIREPALRQRLARGRAMLRGALARGQGDER
ncbi:MAG: RNA polymerase sigma factor [Sandaracinaceae bacterium]